MNKLIVSTLTVTSSIALAASVVAPAYAWHPKGQIIKEVQNVTQNGSYSDANTAAQAVNAKPGDILNYRITVKNVAEAAKNADNDLMYINVTDELPAGVELVKTGDRKVRTTLKDLQPGQSDSTVIQVKVVRDTAGVITNTAGYEGNSKVKDNKQSGCDDAVVKVTIPEKPTPTPETPKTPEAPVTSKTVETPAELPKTGVSSVALIGTGLTALAGYAAYMLRLRRAEA